VWAAASALFGAIHNWSARIARIAGNCYIQNVGAHYTKELERDLWDIQPYGVARWFVRPLNEHDELMVVHPPEFIHEIRKRQGEFLRRARKQIPLLSMPWKGPLKNWEDVKG
jgi:hypothetical protein